ncbi:helix-turn-helix domain-containing protein [Streptomyces sp. WMMC897]|uniref:helix-turn-helix domain-containing protein n=1 Tax=Streptomyces sp. WMMC897 TaxID=3014782 RepID=UPI0022B603B0|nr:helix-turn-helix transcriptional regulator [Streptomyces sp. WMMC897]MCZ7417374.1 helix-turn-helix transcriptional regulator [Streptomyces sp. WMMC897]
MPLRSAPTARQRRLGAELRKLREKIGVSATEASELLGIERTKVSNIETGRAGISAERLRAMACVYECSDSALVNALAAMTGERSRNWWEEYRGILPAGFLDLAELEHHATELRVAHAMHIPGLLQTREYAHAVFDQVVPPLTPPQLEHRVSHRLKRQDVIFRSDPVTYTAFIHEAALRMLFGGRATMRRQLHHLIDMSERPHITVRIVPFSAGAYPGAGQSIGFAMGQVPALDTVQLDTAHGSELVGSESQLVKYRTIIERMGAVSLLPDRSLELVHGIIKETL